MTKYVHLKKGLADKGSVVRLEDLESYIDNPKKQDWYRSAYYYPNAFLKYFDEKGSIAGYTGEAFSDTLYWDIDCSDLNIAKEHAINLLYYLDDLDLLESVRLFFSGSKGFHIVLYTENEFTPEETNSICYNMAVEAQVNIDLVVYNKTRAFRIPNTAHQKTRLLKIELDINDFVESKENFKENISKRAKKAVKLSRVVLSDCSGLAEKYKVKETKVVNIDTGKEYIEDLDMSRCPSNKKRCVYVLENGVFGEGERENGLIRLAASYKAQGFDEEMAESLMTTALDKRDRRYDVKAYNDSDTQRIIKTVFSDSWNGGTYSCKTDTFLESKCDGKGACSQKEEKKYGKTMSATDLIAAYVKDADAALEMYPEFGLKWLDERVLLRPKEITVMNGANGCVDAETEFLSPDGWVKISEWDGQEVMQYNKETSEISLVEPKEYIKLPCKEFTHYKDHNLDQMLSSEHDILYNTIKGKVGSIKSSNLVALSKLNINESIQLPKIKEFDCQKEIYLNENTISIVKSDDGFKYCFTVPTGALLLRRNGLPFITGNSGKTSLMMKIIKKLNLQGIWHKIYSMDMSDSSLFLKFATSYTDYTYREVEAIFNINTRDKKEMANIAAIIERNLPYTKFDFSASYDINDMEKAVEIDEKSLDIKYQLVFVDYAGRIKGKYESMYANSTLTALELNDVAKRTNCHWFMLSQVSRERGDHTWPLRTSRVSKDSGSWEENATTVINVWRPFGNDFNKDYFMHVFIAKNRKGALEEMAFGWNGKKGAIRELEEIEHHEYDEMHYQEFKEMPPNPYNNMEQKEIKEDRFKEKSKEDDPNESDKSYADRTSGAVQRSRRKRS